jgi:nickel-dependent lactate racemase
VKLAFPYPGVPALEIPASARVSWLEPKSFTQNTGHETHIIQRGLQNPIGLPRLGELTRGKQNILILVDDYTRTTPVHLILPQVLAEMYAGGVEKSNIRLLVASGTHRAMTAPEKQKRFGAQVAADHVILDHHYDDLSQLARLPDTPGGTEIWVNRAVLEADFVLGIGHIAPHRVAGFSGGGKIVQPGVCGAVTTGQTHWLSARYLGAEIIGKVDNPVRREIDAVARAAGLKYIINAVMDGAGRLVSCVCGDPHLAFQAGAQQALEVFGAPLSEPADIVIAESFPADMELWQAAKAVYAADLALKPGGILILVTPCPEGVSAEYPQVTQIGYQSYEKVKALVDCAELTDLTVAAHLVHMGRVICEKGQGVLVSPGINAATAARIGFHWMETPQAALDYALQKMGTNAAIAVLKNGGEIMPVIGNAGHD